MLRNFIKHFKRQPSSATSRDVDLANCSTSTAIDTGSSRVRAKLFENVKITQREKRDKLLSSRRGDLGSANSEEDNTSSSSQTNATYLVDNNQMAVKKPAMTKHEEMKREQTNNRRKMLEEWRAKKKKENEMKQVAAAAAPKPTFKVHHVDNRLFEKPKSTLPTSSSFNFHMKLDASSQSAPSKRAVTVSNLHSSATTTAPSTAAAIGQVKKPVTRSQSKIETKKPIVEHKPVPVPTSRDKPHAPVRSTSSASVSSAASAVAARRAPPPSTTAAESHAMTRRNVSASSVGTKKQTTAPKATSSTQFVAPMPPPPPAPPQSNANTTISMHQPLATSSTSDLLAAEVDRISNKIGSSVTISSKRLSKDRLSNTIVQQQQPPQTPTITISEEKETPKTMTQTVQSPPKAAPVQQQLDCAYFDSIELDKRDVAYYKALVDFKTSLLNSYRAQWTERLDAEGALVPDDVQGDVRAACGLAHLLIKERFDQFSDLIQQCENAQTIAQSGDVSEMPALVVRCSDLQGFWDMVEKQVENVTVRFEYLEKVKSNNYVKTPELDEFLFNKLSSDNKPKETTGEVKKPTKFIRPTYLKKTTAAAKTDENKPDESTEVAAKPKPKPAVSRFAEFRKAKLQQANAVAAPSTDTAEVEIMLPPMPKTPGSSECAPAALTESAEILNSAQTKSAKSRRSSRKSNVVVEPKRYNLRSRPSDLIKFDSPVSGGSRASILPTMHLHTLDEDSSMICSPSTSTTKQTSDPFSTPGAHITKSMKKPLIRNVAADLLEEAAEEENAIQEEDENKENTVIDYLGECGAVLGSAPINVMTLKMRASIAPSAMGQSAYTPQKRVSMAVRESLEPDRIVNLSRSPLLKLALISSHSKRLSLSRPNDFPPL